MKILRRIVLTNRNAVLKLMYMIERGYPSAIPRTYFIICGTVAAELESNMNYALCKDTEYRLGTHYMFHIICA